MPRTKTILPNFFIAGASKSGTTSLFEYLKGHPEILLTDEDNVNFFSRESNLETPGGYNDYFSLEPGKNPADYAYTGEGTANYLFLDEVPRRMHELLPEEPKLVFILRSPIDRAVSHFWHKHKNFKDLRDLSTVFSFDVHNREELRQTEEARIDRALSSNMIRPGHLYDIHDDVKMNFRYLTNSFYSLHLSNYLDYFSKENILVLLTEELKNSAEKTVKKIESFLGVQEYLPDNLSRKYNKSIVPKHDFLSDLIHRYVRPAASQLLPDAVRPDALVSWYHNLTYQNKPETPNWVKKELSHHYLAEQEYLRNTFNLDPSPHWDLEEFA